MTKALEHLLVALRPGRVAARETTLVKILLEPIALRRMQIAGETIFEGLVKD